VRVSEPLAGPPQEQPPDGPQTDERRRPDAGRRRWLLGFGLLVVVIAAAVAVALLASKGSTPVRISVNDVTAWTSPSARPLSDAEAAAEVTDVPEQRPGNAQANDYVPSDAQLAAFRGARDSSGQTNEQSNPLLAYVTGRPGLRHPSTDDLIQWVSHKWGIPTDWIRAEMVVESGWHQSQAGDEAAVSPAWYAAYPAFARVAGTRVVNESLGIAQVKWRPDGSVGAGTEPLRWLSTAFNLDYYAATVRFFYDGYCHWCSAGYSAGQSESSVGAWYSPSPWNNSGARQYIAAVASALSAGAWAKTGF